MLVTNIELLDQREEVRPAHFWCSRLGVNTALDVLSKLALWHRVELLTCRWECSRAPATGRASWTASRGSSSHSRCPDCCTTTHPWSTGGRGEHNQPHAFTTCSVCLLKCWWSHFPNKLKLVFLFFVSLDACVNIFGFGLGFLHIVF